MRLSVSLLLITLALCCHEGNAVVCPAVLAEHTVFLLGTQTQFRLLLAKFNAPPEASEAMITVKKCTDNISYLKRVLVEEALGEILLQCPV
ncbi:secretoglobin family 1D member 2-like [Ochotona curzoniae]|uniref:secretoglobin family 1D member 2-like n=1 Tax=Ochotona curzoniae TaxID=130825 RepID=UPI001B347EB0|nr:secretoglobin family 1D member 2-like [Ochotona curzoniae]